MLINNLLLYKFKTDTHHRNWEFFRLLISVPRLDRMSSPAQSEDSGLAADRGTYTTYATISIPRNNAQAMGIVFAGKFRK